MGKTTTSKRKSTNDDPVQGYMEVVEAKQRFIGTVLNMGWRMAITFIIPIILGSWLDNRYDTRPSYTITGLFIAIGASAMIVAKTVKEVNEESAELYPDKPKKKKRVKDV